jgi:hypothetical protein
MKGRALALKHSAHEAHSENNKHDCASDYTDDVCRYLVLCRLHDGCLIFYIVYVAEGFTREITTFILFVETPRVLPVAATVPSPSDIYVLH